MLRKYHFVYLLLVCATYQALCEYLSLSEGDSCSWKGLNGTCAQLHRCLSAKDFAELTDRPPMCEFKGKVPVICCTDCELVDDARNIIIGDLRLLHKNGQKAHDHCLIFKHTLNYFQKHVVYTAEKNWTVVKERNCQELKYRITGGISPAGGHAVRKGQFPHVALLGYGPEWITAQWLCGGALISTNFVLTAGHCISSPLFGPVTYLGLGVHQRSEPPGEWQRYRVKRIIPHPDYHPPSKYNDIALLETFTPKKKPITESQRGFNGEDLARKIILGAFVNPACLNKREEKNRYNEATGWGKLGHRRELAKTLQVVSGGRNDIPSRLKRLFAIFNCPLPNNDSIDKIFKVIGEGHYNAKRGFTSEVRNLIKKIIPLTRELWTRTRAKLLPTPAKFHYVFSLRDLSRVWQGMVGTLPTVIESEKCLMLLWKHECSRVFSDRFTHEMDKTWFNKALYDIAQEVLGVEYKKMMEKEPVFVDFMRDAPEPTGEEGEDADMELPKVYEPVFDYAELRERLDMFLSQFNEMVRGSGMDLVFFPDAMLHLVKISRVIRHPRGNVMLVGVGGSGKQSLTKLSTFIAGYRSFQIALTRSYNVGNFLEDLKLLYRSCGVQGKGTTFIFTDLDIKEEGFLEYLNNILSSGVISNLFTKDEQQEIISELTPIMKRENQKRTLTNELVMEYFLNRTCQNLHVVLCFSPVSEAFRYRALRFPALISGCTIDWFQPWPKDALVSVADHFLAEFEIECTKEVKKELVTVLGTIQDVVSKVSGEYFQRFRRSSHVTPKSYLSFIAGYKTIYQMKQKELGDGALRMDTGLEKLREASISVEVLKKDLAVMEQDLALASEKADRVLTEVTERAMQAEIVKNQVQIVKEKAEVLVAYIAEEKEKAEIKLEAAKPALEEAESALNTIKPAHIATVRKLGRPPHLIMRIMDCVLILFQRRLHPLIPDTAAPCPKPSWAESLKMMASTTFLLQLQNYPKDIINNEMVEHLFPYFEMEDYNMDTAKRVCGDVAGLLSWTKAMAFFHSVNKEVLPLKANLLLQEARLKIYLEEFSEEECNREYPPHRHLVNGYNHTTQMCYGRRDRLIDTCEGDSGGPLHDKREDSDHIIGVTSYGRACGISTGAGIYTRVSFYLPWIESIVWPDSTIY